MILTLVGFILLCSIVIAIAKYIAASFITKRELNELGQWAVISGATDGIGKAYATEIAHTNQMSLCLIARSDDKLKDLTQELSEIKGFDKDVKCIRFDFAEIDADYLMLKNELKKLDVGLLLNNVGISYPGSQFFHEIPARFVDELVNVNVKSAMHLTHMVYGEMRARRRGAIVCMGSAASVVAEPMLVGYAACKGALEALCRSLQAECRDCNVLVQCQTPLMVTSKMSKIRKASIMVPSPRDYAKAGLQMVKGATIDGLAATPTTISPYYIHALILGAVSFLPNMIWEKYRMGEQTYMAALYKKKIAEKAQ